MNEGPCMVVSAHIDMTAPYVALCKNWCQFSSLSLNTRWVTSLSYIVQMSSYSRESSLVLPFISLCNE